MDGRAVVSFLTVFCYADTVLRDILVLPIVFVFIIVLVLEIENIIGEMYSVSQKKVAPVKLFAIFSLLVNLCN